MSSDPSRTPARADLHAELLAKLRGKAKPVGSLGRLEDLAVRLGMIAGTPVPHLGAAKVLVFAGDHGLTDEGVTAYPSAVTHEIAKLIVAGGAGISVLARATGIPVELIDAGMLQPLPPAPGLHDARIGPGTRNSRRESAMSEDQCTAALAAGRAIDDRLGREGVGIVGYGEVGIGNSSAAALVAHLVSGIDLDRLIGPGAGAPADGLDHKRRVLSEAIARERLSANAGPARAFEALRRFGGFEMAMMAGAMTAAAQARRVIVVDGFISTAVAIAAAGLEPATLDNCIFAHCSAEPGHRALLDHVGEKPLLELDMRLGEGTGAALAIPLVRAAELMLREMADLPGEHPA